MGKIVVTLTKEKETKRTWRYVNEDEGSAISAIYISKKSLEGIKTPEIIAVTVEGA